MDILESREHADGSVTFSALFTPEELKFFAQEGFRAVMERQIKAENEDAAIVALKDIVSVIGLLGTDSLEVVLKLAKDALNG